MAQPLEGMRILVTRAVHQAGKLCDALRALGAEPVEVPVLEIRPPKSYDALDAAFGRIETYDWLILTSANTVCALADRAAALGILLAPAKPDRVVAKNIPFSAAEPEREGAVLKGHGFSHAEKAAKIDGASAPEGVSFQIAAIGEATATAARNAGLAVALIPPAYVAEQLIESLTDRVAEKKILLARAAIARDVIPDALRAAGAHVDVVEAYQNVMPETAPTLLREALRKGIDAATFTSSSSVIHLAEAARAADVAFPLPGVAAISIGPITSEALREHNWEPAIEADPHDIPGLIVATTNLLAR